ncbi:uncharacterized protein BO97DRAFT_446121 [Aspergillus homomorphus CBS 101889]|uniref:Mid2 domain-containing protein n=1 Tax=Aspergillus homomorphus (strain CBS 101889) TaxID=1450537 RepID=A0A395HL37_ASPHC|nr:hypothetical protein BO97DRAFT_446121 [Aspergillus homomorphus CBS 101889]RAL08480.1 hypothetical protein BO97DRAFT_446121 [Aspergillus homomorphus CBS 101889]
MMDLLGLLRNSLLVAWILVTPHWSLVRAEGFTFPNDGNDRFIVGDLVNVTWDIVSARVSLYEMCATAVLLESNVSNTESYIWNATRANYRESGCAFELVPLTADGSPNPPNLTSVLFGVNKRYSNDPSPTSYNFGGTTFPTTTLSPPATSTSASTLATTANPYTGTAEPASATATSTSSTANEPTALAKGGLTVAQKVGIGLGVPLGVLALSLVGALVFMYRRRRLRQGRVVEQEQPPPPPPQDYYAAVPSMAPMAEPPKDPFNAARMSRAETLIAELPAADMEVESETRSGQRPVSELMGTPRNELT